MSNKLPEKKYSSYMKMLPKTLLIVFSFHETSFADVVCTTAPRCEYSSATGSIGGNQFTLIGTFQPGYDSLTFTSTNDIRVFVTDATDISKLPYKIWEHVTFGSVASPHRKVDFLGTNLDQLAIDGYTRTVQMSDLQLYNVDLTTSIRFLFVGTNNKIDLHNSGMYFSDQMPGFIAAAPLTINAHAGSNYFKNWTDPVVSQSTTINIEPGATLLFEASGSTKLNAYRTDRLHFDDAVTGNVDNGTLKLAYSNVYFNSDAFDFTNNSTLELQGYQTQLEFENASFDASNILLGRNTFLTAENMTMDNAAADLRSNAILSVEQLLLRDATLNILEEGGKIKTSATNISTTATLTGSTAESAGLYAGFLTLQNNAIFNQNGSAVYADNLVLYPGSQLNVNGKTFYVTQNGGSIFTFGGTANITNNGTFSMGAALDPGFVDVTFNIDNSSQFQVRNGTELLMTPSVNINNEGTLFVDGSMIGNGVIKGDGIVQISPYGLLSPGDSYFSGNEIGTLTFENGVNFSNNTFPGDQPQPQYLAHIDVAGGIEKNDRLQYNHNNFNATDLTSIKVDTIRPITADELSGKKFTIVSSLDAGSTGVLKTDSNYPAIIESANIPALIDFLVIDNNTNGKADITLLAKKDYNHLAKHTSTIGKNHNSATALLLNAVNSGNPQITSALNNLTNSQVGPHLDTIHPEPYSSYMTISLEHSDMVMNTVLDYAAASRHVRASRINEIEEKRSGKRFWMDVSYAEGDVNGDDELGNFGYNLSNLTIGQDLIVTEDRTLGLYFSHGTQEMDEHDKAEQDFSSTLSHVGMYMNQLTTSGWDLRSVFGYAYGDNSSNRRVTLGNMSTNPSAEYDSHSAYAGVRAAITGYEDNLVTLSPEFGFSYIYYSRESFNESGDPHLSLALDSANTKSIIASAGINARFAELSEAMSIYPLAFLRYEHDFFANANNKHEIDAALVAHPDYKQTFVGQNRGENSIITGLGIGSDITDALQINGGLIHSASSHGNELGASLDVRYNW